MEAWWFIPGSQTMSYDKQLPKPITMKYPWYNSLNRPPKIIFKARQAADSTDGACAGKTIQLIANPADGSTNVEALAKGNSDGDFVISASGQLQVEMSVGTEGCAAVGRFGLLNGTYSTDHDDFRGKIEGIVSSPDRQQEIIEASESEHINGCNVFDCNENISLGLTGQPFARDIVDTFTTSQNVFNDREDNLADGLAGYLAGFVPGPNTRSKDQSIDFLGYLKDYFDGNFAGGGFLQWTNDTLTANAIPNRTNVIRKYLFALENIMVEEDVVLPVGCEYQISASIDNSNVKQMDYLRYNHPEGDISEVLDWEIKGTAENLSGNSTDTDSPCYNPVTRQLDDKCQELISPLPGFGDFVDENLTIGEYLNTMLRIIIGFMGIAAVILIIFAGIRYMTADAFQAKNNAKELITNSFLGLAVIVSIWVIFNTINPDLLTLDFDTRLQTQVLNSDAGEEFITITGAGNAPSNAGRFQEWVNTNGSSFAATFTKIDGTTTTITPCDNDKMKTGNIGGESVTIHEDAIPYLEKVIENLNNAGIPYSFKSAGGYNCRPVTGRPNSVSKHSYGLAIDINPNENPYVRFPDALPSSGEEKTFGSIVGKFSSPILSIKKINELSFKSERAYYTDMPEAFVKAWRDAGWCWGGDWNDNLDAMHFSLFESECRGDSSSVNAPAQ